MDLVRGSSPSLYPKTKEETPRLLWQTEVLSGIKVSGDIYKSHIIKLVYDKKRSISMSLLIFTEFIVTTFLLLYDRLQRFILISFFLLPWHLYE